MKKILNFLALLIIIALGGIYFLFGPNVFFGGPKTSDIIEVTRNTMLATASSPELKIAAQQAKITTKGICSKEDNKYACGVNIEIASNPVKEFVAVLSKNADGVWVTAE